MKRYRMRLVRLSGPLLERMEYIGTAAGIPAGWSVVLRRNAR